jgi:hypothetical protein
MQHEAARCGAQADRMTNVTGSSEDFLCIAGYSDSLGHCNAEIMVRHVLTLAGVAPVMKPG